MTTATFDAGSANLVSLRNLLESVEKVRIPDFQRPYDWRERQVAELIRDLYEAKARGKALFLGLVVLYKDKRSYLIIDGQQRLTTMLLALSSLESLDIIYRVEDGLKVPWVATNEQDRGLFQNLISGQPLVPAETLSQRLLIDAHKLLRDLDSRGVASDDLLKCEFIVYVSPSLLDATGLYERINLRGREVSRFDLVKNKLIEWCAAIPTERSRADAEKNTLRTYERLYKLLNPTNQDGYREMDADQLLRVHWILFDKSATQSSDVVLDKLEERLQRAMKAKNGVRVFIDRYLKSLEDIAVRWLWITRPMSAEGLDEGVLQALRDFAKLNRESEFLPILVAALFRLRNLAAPVINLCEILSFRSVLAGRRSSKYRSAKWSIAKAFYQRTLQDTQDKPITRAGDLAHHIFWRTRDWWSPEEQSRLEKEDSKRRGSRDNFLGKTDTLQS